MPPKTFPSPRVTWSDGRETSLDPFQIESSFLGRIMRQGQVPFDQYLSDIGSKGNTQEILERLQRGTLKGYHMTDDMYNQMGQAGEGNVSAWNSQGFYRPASSKRDTARFFLIQFHSPTTPFHEIAHDVVGHRLSSVNTPPLSFLDILDKRSDGKLPYGAYKTKKGYEEEFGNKEDAADVFSSVYSDTDPAHPKLTQAHFDKYIEEPTWDAFPPTLQDSLTRMGSGRMAYPKQPPKNAPKQSFWEYLWN